MSIVSYSTKLKFKENNLHFFSVLASSQTLFSPLNYLPELDRSIICFFAPFISYPSRYALFVRLFKINLSSDVNAMRGDYNLAYIK
jgi:hypothetical protein